MEFSIPEVSFELQQQKIYSLLDFVMECNRNHRFTSRMLEPENSFVSIMEDAVLDSAITVDSSTALSPYEDENEIVNVPKEHVEDNLPKFHPARTGLSAIRSFPPGCGRDAPPLRVRHGSKCLKNRGRYNKAIPKFEKKSSAARVSRDSPITHRTESEDHKSLEDPLRKTSGNEDGSIEGKLLRVSDDVKFELGELATDHEPMVKRVVVQALNAAPNCPWRDGKRILKSKPTIRDLKIEED